MATRASPGKTVPAGEITVGTGRSRAATPSESVFASYSGNRGQQAGDDGACQNDEDQRPVPPETETESVDPGREGPCRRCFPPDEVVATDGLVFRRGFFFAR